MSFPALAQAFAQPLGDQGRGRVRVLPEEVPLVLVCQGTTYAVMMGTPSDLADFALGFCLSEGLIASKGEIDSLEIVDLPQGIELRLWLAEPRASALEARRRYLAGPVGCGLCGIDSLAEALRVLPRVVPADRPSESAISAALSALEAAQPLHDQSHAVHAAAFCQADGKLIVREDVGRHNALDKLIGALASGGVDLSGGFVLMTSRVSVELVQKCAMVGIGTLVAVSAPTLGALRQAKASGIRVISRGRDGVSYEFSAEAEDGI